MIKEVILVITGYLFCAVWMIAATPFFTQPLESPKMAVSDNLTEVEQIILNIHNAHNYTANYTCHNYTIDSVNALKSKGFNATYIYGKSGFNESQAHAWVRVCNNGNNYGWCTDYDVTAGIKRPTYTVYSLIVPCDDDGKNCEWEKLYDEPKL
jgi:hypothetical protein